MDMMTIPQDEETEARTRRRQTEMREIAWLHCQASHARFLRDCEAGLDVDAFNESTLTLEWEREYRRLGDA